MQVVNLLERRRIRKKITKTTKDMYIRRKVFSILQDEEGEEKLFSTTEFINEDYGYEQREFTEE